MEKERTWPYAVVPNADHSWNVRKLDGRYASPNAMSKPAAIWLRDLLNEAFDWGRRP